MRESHTDRFRRPLLGLLSLLLALSALFFVAETLAATTQRAAPEAVNDAATTDEDTPIVIDVLENDSDADGDPLTIVELFQPLSGTVTLAGANIRYTPQPNIFGVDHFFYAIEDPDGGQSVAQVVITVTAVNDGPQALDDQAVTLEDSSVMIDVLANDSDVEDETLTLAAVAPPPQGQAAIVGQQVIYTPSQNFHGSTVFSYTVADSDTAEATARITVTVMAVNDRPQAVDDSAQVDEDMSVTIDVLDNDDDADGDELNIIAVGQPLSATTAIVGNQIVFTPALNYNGLTTFSYTVADDGGLQDTATVSVTVNPVNDAPVARGDSAFTDEDMSVMIAVLDNDYDVDGDPITLRGVSTPSIGTASISGDLVIYTPTANFEGIATLIYVIEDPAKAQHGAIVTVTVGGINDPPVAVDDTAETDEDVALSIAVLANDSDDDGDTLSLDFVGQPANGETTIDAERVVYTPTVDFHGVDVFSYTVGDGGGLTDSALVTVTVRSVNDGPTAVDDMAATAEDTPLTVDVLDNDEDRDGDALTIVFAAQPASGSSSIVANEIRFEPAQNFNGLVQFDYIIEDPSGEQDQATVTVTVSAVNDPPQALDDFVETLEDSAVTVFVLANDSDVDGDSLSLIAGGPAQHGAVQIESTFAIYTPELNFNGTDAFTYTVADPVGGEATATVFITVTTVSDRPTANDDEAETDEDMAVTVDVLVNDLDPDGDGLQIVAVDDPADGDSAVVANQIVFTPTLNFNGQATFSYTIENAGGQSTAVIRVDVAPVNDAPSAVDDEATTVEDTPLTIDVLDNDEDIDGDELTIVFVAQPSSGSSSIVANEIRFEPAQNYNGPAHFDYIIEDPSGEQDIATVTVTVSADNDSPQALDDFVETLEDSAVTVFVLANDSDVDGDSLSLIAGGPAQHGAVQIESTFAIYTPELNFNGTDAFTYTVADPIGAEATATVFITVTAVSDRPTANDDEAETDEDMVVTIDVLVNDFDPDGDGLQIVAVDDPANGDSAIVANQVVFTPELNFNGQATFSYTIESGGGQSTAVIRVDIAAVNDAPVANDDATTTPEGNAVIIDVLANDFDVDGDPLFIITVDQPDEGSATIRNRKIEYSPPLQFNGLVTFSYTIADLSGAQASAFVTVDVGAVNDAPTAADDSAVTDEDQPVVIDVLANDSDPDGDSLAITALMTPTVGTAQIESNQIRYTPPANYHGVAVFGYVIEDPGGLQDQATVTVTVRSVNDAPIAVDDSAATNEDQAVTIDVLANDSDPDGDSLSITSVDDFVGGSAAISGTQIVFTPNPNFNGSGSFSYLVEDPQGLTDPAAVDVTIAPVNDAPQPQDDTAVTAEDTPVSVNVLANDSDPDNEALTIVAIGEPAHGVAAIGASGIVYTPSLNYFGSDALSYTVEDPQGTPAQATVALTVTPVNDPPQASDDSASTAEDTVRKVDVLQNDSDVDGDTLTIVDVSTPANGQAEIVGTEIEFRPNANFHGETSFSYTVEDAAGAQDSAIVRIDVSAQNDSPQAVDDEAQTDEDTPIAVDVVANDFDVDGDDLTIVAAGDPVNATVEIDGDALRVAPAADINGLIVISYTIADEAGAQSSAQLMLTVLPVNDAPVALDDSATIGEGSTALIDVLSNDYDPDDDLLLIVTLDQPSVGSATIRDRRVEYTPPSEFNGDVLFGYTIADPSGERASALITVTVGPENDPPRANDDIAMTAEDTVVLIDVLANDSDPDGDTLSIAAVDDPANGATAIVANEVRFTPAANFNGVVVFGYTAEDPSGASATATVTVTVSAVNDGPLAVDDVAAVDEDDVVIIDVLANDSDPDDDPLSIAAVDDPANGTTAIVANEIRFTPAADFNGVVTFGYTVEDTSGSADSALITVTVRPVNDAPIANDDSVETVQNVPLLIMPLANDSDADGDSLTLVAIGTPSSGAAQIIGSSILFTPTANFSGVVFLGYTIEDTAGAEASAEITIDIEALNLPPQPQDDSYATGEDDLLIVAAPGVLQNDDDPDGDTLVVNAATFSTARGARVTFSPNGALSYDPRPSAQLQSLVAGEELVDSFQYVVSDGEFSRSGTVRVTVAGANELMYLPLIQISNCTDRFEPNNSFGQATPLAQNVVVAATLCRDDPGDYFSFIAPADGSVVINLTDLAASSDVDLFLYNKNNVVIASSTTGLLGDNERISVSNLTAGDRYIIFVFPFEIDESADNVYRLTWR